MIFQVSGLQKLAQNQSKNAFEKNIEKNTQKIDFGIHFGLPKRPKIAPNSTKSLRKAMRNEACFATLWDLPTSRRKLTGLIVCKPSKWLGI